MLNVLYADVHALFYESVANDLIDNDANGMGRDIVHNSCPSLGLHQKVWTSEGAMKTDPW